MQDKNSRSKLIYWVAFMVLFLVEVLIALFVHDDIVRPHIGDLLVVMLIYCFARAVFNWKVSTAAMVTLLFAYLVETLQYFRIVEVLGLEENIWAKVIIGTYFSWIDILAYTAGVILILVIEKLRRQ